MKNNQYGNIDKVKSSFIDKNKVLINEFKKFGYILKFRFEKKENSNMIKYYIISEIFPVGITKSDAIKSKQIKVYIIPFLVSSNNKIKVYNKNLSLLNLKLCRFMNKRNKKIKNNLLYLFIISAIYPKIFERYYKKDFSVLGIILLTIFFIVFAILEAKHYTNYMREIFGI